MKNDFWIDLPVKDLKKAKEFFTQLGFEFAKGMGNSDFMVHLSVGNKGVIINLSADTTFTGFTGNGMVDTHKGNEVLFNIGAESRDEVDQWAEKVTTAGGTLLSAPAERQGWMYGCSFADLDGHRWIVLHMDMSKMPKG